MVAGVLFGRERELEVLERVLGDAQSGMGSLVLVTGEAGIGKTRLVDELSARAEALGFATVWGRSWEGEGTPAYWPWLQVLRSLQTILPAVLDEAVATSSELSSLLAPGRSGEQPADPALARFRLFDVLWQLLRAAAQQRPLVLVLDDVHAADLASQRLLQFIARHLRGVRLLLVATAREPTFEASGAGFDALAKVAREGVHLPLGRLGREDVAGWLAASAPQLCARLEAVFGMSEGNPLFVHELLAAARQRPDSAWTPARLPLGIRDAVRGHLSVLSPPATRGLQIASVSGRDFSLVGLELLAPAADMASAVTEAVAAGIVTDLGDGRLRFSHVLLRDELYASLGPERADLHRRLATQLRDQPAQAAQHALLGLRPEHAGEVAGVVLAAMRADNHRLAFEDAAALGQRAVALVGPHLEPAAAAALSLAVIEANGLAGKEDLAACARLADVAEALGDAQLLGRIALLAGAEHTMNRREGVIALLRRALAGQPPQDSPLRAQLMARLGAALVPPLPEEGREFATLAAESQAMARRLGDAPTLFTTLQLAMVTFPEHLEPHERARVLTESIALAKRLGQTARVVSLLGPQIACQLELGDLSATARELESAEQLLARFPQPHYQWRAPLLRSLLAALQGRFAEADAQSRLSLKIAEENEVVEGMTMFCLQRIANAYISGDPESYREFDELATRLLARNPLQPLFRAMPDALMGRTAETREALAKARTRDPDSIPGLFALAWAGLVAGIHDHAEFFYDALERRHAHDQLLFGPGALLTLGPTGLLLGRLAAQLGWRDKARRHYREALACAQRIQALPYVAQTERALAELDTGQHAAPATGPAPPASVPRPEAISLSRSGETWALGAGDKSVVLRESKGLHYLELLVSQPHREIHALELAGRDDDGDAGVLLDERAKRAYRERAEALRDTLEAATSDNDLGRAERARAELDALADELSRAVGLGGRDRRAGSAAERARVNVQRRLRDVIKRVAEHDTFVARHLEASLKTGLFCVYDPVWPA